MSCIVYGSVKCGNYNDMNYLLVTITHILITFTVAYYVLLNVAFYVLGISLSNFKLYHKNSVCVCVCVCVCGVYSVIFDSLQPHGLQTSRFPWDFPGKNAGVGCYFLFHGIFPTPGSNLSLLCLFHWQTDYVSLCHLGTPAQGLIENN